MKRWRSASVALIITAGLGGMIFLLTQEGTAIWCVLLGGVTGTAAGWIGWGRGGALTGGLVGCALGALAPAIYIPFWMLFTLPPHPKIDF